MDGKRVEEFSLVRRIGAWSLEIGTSGLLDEGPRAQQSRLYNLVAWVTGGIEIEPE